MSDQPHYNGMNRRSYESVWRMVAVFLLGCVMTGGTAWMSYVRTAMTNSEVQALIDLNNKSVQMQIENTNSRIDLMNRQSDKRFDVIDNKLDRMMQGPSRGRQQ